MLGVFTKTNINTIKTYTHLFNTNSILKIPRISFKPYRTGMDLRYIPDDKFVLSSFVAPKSNKKNLYKEFMNKNYQNTEDLEKLLSEFPDSDRNVGRLPDSWLKLIKPDERKDKTIEVQSAFSEFAERTLTASNKSTGWNKCNRQKLVAPIDDLSKKLGEIFNQNIEIRYIQSGSVGKCFQVIMNNTETALKTFHPIEALTLKDANKHGKSVEVAMGIYTKKHGAPKQFPTFYMGKVGRRGDNDAFMLTRFVDRKNAKQYIDSRTIRSEIFFIKSSDGNDNNFVKGTNIEFGDAHVDERFRDWKTRKIAIELANALDANSPKRIKKIVAKYGGSKEFESAKTSVEEILRVKQDEFKASYTKLPLPKEAMEELGVSHKRPLDVLLKQNRVETLMFYKYQWKDIDKVLKENKIKNVLEPKDLGSIFKESKDKKGVLNAVSDHMDSEVKKTAVNEMLCLGITPKEIQGIGIDRETIKGAVKEIGLPKYILISAVRALHIKTTKLSQYS